MGKKKKEQKNSNFTLILFFLLLSSKQQQETTRTPWMRIVDELRWKKWNLFIFKCHAYIPEEFPWTIWSLFDGLKTRGNSELSIHTQPASSAVRIEPTERALSTVRDTRENQRQMERSSKPINNIFLLAWTHKKKNKKNQNFSFHFYSNTQRNLHTKKWEFSLLCVIGPMGSLKCLITCKRGEENTQWERRRTMSSGWGGWRDQSWHRQMKTQSRKKYTVRIPQPTTSSSSVIPLYVFTSNDSPARVEENMETRRMTTKTFLNNFFCLPVRSFATRFFEVPFRMNWNDAAKGSEWFTHRDVS